MLREHGHRRLAHPGPEGQAAVGGDEDDDGEVSDGALVGSVDFLGRIGVWAGWLMD